jgi:hypothetical protein
MNLDSPSFELPPLPPSPQPPSSSPGVHGIATPPLLATLPDEIILAVLGLLDVPELYALTKVSFYSFSFFFFSLVSFPFARYPKEDRSIWRALHPPRTFCETALYICLLLGLDFFFFLLSFLSFLISPAFLELCRGERAKNGC